MKGFLLFFVSFLFVSSTFAKDINLRFNNRVNADVMVYTGLITAKQNYYSDEDIIEHRDDFGFTSMKRPIRALKKGQSKINDAKNSQVLIVFGLFEGGGRTVVYRYRVRDIKAALEIVFHDVPIHLPNMSYINIAKVLFESGDAGQTMPVGNVPVTGNFVFYDIASENINDLLVMRPIERIPAVQEDVTDVQIGDFLYKDAKIAYNNLNGNVVREIPEESNEAYYDIILPGIDRMPSVFATTNYKYLTWNIVNSGDVNAKPDAKSYLEIINGCRAVDKRMVIDRYMRDVLSKGSSDMHLYFITSVRRIDSIYITESLMEPLAQTDLIMENDLFTSQGNYRFTGKERTVFQQAYAIKDLKALDLTPLLQYIVIVEGEFIRTALAASSLIELYYSLGNYIELPQLEDDVLSLRNSGFSISKIKEIVGSSDLQAKIEAKLKSDIHGTIPINVATAIRQKLDTGR